MRPEPHLPSTREETIVEDDRSRCSSLEGPPRKQARQDFHCQLCNKHYQNSRSLKRHEREDRGHLALIGRELENVYECHITDCGHSFARRWDLGRHISEKHDGQKRKVPRIAPIIAEPVTSDVTCPELSTSDSTPAGTVSSSTASSDEIADWKAEPWITQHSISASGRSDSDSTQPNWSLSRINSPVSQIDAPIEDNAATIDDETQANSIENQCLNESQGSFPSPALRDTSEPPTSEGHLDLLPGAQLDQDCDGMSTRGHIRLSMSCEPEMYRSDTRLDDDSASVSTVSSMLSSLSLTVPFRSGLSKVDATRNPRPRQLAFPKPCPICGKEFGVDIGAGYEVQAHLDFHMRAMQDKELMASCMICQVSFVHVKDLEWHLNWSEQQASCGFPHAVTEHCTGHHPPSGDPRLQQGHLKFSQQLRNWEAVQLRDFVTYVDEYARGAVRTNAPRYGVPNALWCRSTGSIQSVRSLLSNRSAPTWIDYHSRSRFATTEPLNSITRRLPNRGRSPDSHLVRSIEAHVRAGHVTGAWKLLGSLPRGTFIHEVQGLIKTAINGRYPGVLQLLVDSRNSTAGEADCNTGNWHFEDLLPDDLSLDHLIKWNQKGYAHCLAILLNGGVHFREPNEESWITLHLFSKANIPDDVLPLVTKINSSALQSVACVASYCGSTGLLKHLLMAGVDANASIRTDQPWHGSVAHDHGTRSALSYATAEERIGCATLLLEHNALNDRDCRVDLMEQACAGERSDLLIVLLATDPTLESDALAFCLKLPGHGRLNFLLQHRPSCRHLLFKIHSSVEAAVRFGNYDTVDLLIEHGADFWSANGEGKTPADIAEQAGKTELLGLLVQRLEEREQRADTLLLDICGANELAA